MAVFNFDQVENYVQDDKKEFEFLKLQDDQWFAKVRFMYGEGETFQGYSVHNVSTDPKRPKYIPCLREPGQSLDVCPLCAANNTTVAQYYIPIYVISITKVINGIPQPEEVVNKPMLFQRGKTFQGAMASAIRQSQGTPLVNNVFNIVRSGRANDLKTSYMVEFVGRDNTTLKQLPEKLNVLGSAILPEVTAQEMVAKYLQPQAQQPAGIMPRTVSANTFTTGTVMNQQNFQNPQATLISNSSDVPF